MVEREGKGVIDSVNLLNIELISTIEIMPNMSQSHDFYTM